LNERKKFEIVGECIEMLSMFSVCAICGKAPATQLHHKFSQTKSHIQLYGNLMHHPENIQAVCHNCHMNRAKKLTEKEFCDMLSIPIRSKSGIFKMRDTSINFSNG